MKYRANVFLKLCYWDSATTAGFMDYILKINKRKKKVGGLGRTRSQIFCFAKFLDPASCPPVAGHSGFQVLPVSEVATKIS